MKNYRIAVLLHENANEEILKSSLIHVLSEYWSNDGHEVFFLYGIKRYVPADLVIVHVDLTVVPDSYLEFASQYPKVINGNIKDIRKSTFSQNILHSDDDWDGPVIVKSDKNCAGVPERLQNGFMGRAQKKFLDILEYFKIESMLPAFRSSYDYKIYDHLKKVPKLYFYRSDLVIQKFIPEMDGTKYCVRTISFVGDHLTPKRLKGNNPIVKGETVTEMEYDIEPHPEIVEMMHQLQFDYGKFDYVVVDDKPLLLDINKTVGISPHLESNFNMVKTHRYQADGLYQFLTD